jgi:hypothetical protein
VLWRSEGAAADEKANIATFGDEWTRYSFGAACLRDSEGAGGHGNDEKKWLSLD